MSDDLLATYYATYDHPTTWQEFKERREWYRKNGARLELISRLNMRLRGEIPGQPYHWRGLYR